MMQSRFVIGVDAVTAQGLGEVEQVLNQLSSEMGWEWKQVHSMARNPDLYWRTICIDTMTPHHTDEILVMIRDMMTRLDTKDAVVKWISAKSRSFYDSMMHT